jgi:hypothetical protein
MAAAIAFVGWMAAESMRTTALTTKENQAVETSAGAEAEVEPTKFEITPSPVIEPNPKFFVSTGDGSSGSHEEPQHR